MGLRLSQQAAFRHRQCCYDQQENRQTNTSRFQRFGFLFSDCFHRFDFAFEYTHTRFDDFHRDPGGNHCQDHTGNHQEVPVGGRIDDNGLVEQVDGRLGKAYHQDVERVDDHVGAKSAGDGRISRQHAGQGIFADCAEHHRRDWRHDDEAGIAGGVRIDCHKDDNRDNHGSAAFFTNQSLAQQRREQSGLFRQTDAKNRDQHDAERREAGKVGNRIGNHLL